MKKVSIDYRCSNIMDKQMRVRKQYRNDLVKVISLLQSKVGYYCHSIPYAKVVLSESLVDMLKR